MRMAKSILSFALAILAVIAIARGFAALTPGEVALVAVGLVGVVFLMSAPGS